MYVKYKYDLCNTMDSMDDLATNQGRYQGGMTKKCLGERSSWGRAESKECRVMDNLALDPSKTGKRGTFSIFFCIVEEE